MYSSSKPLQTSLFRFSMSGTKILAMFDPSMLGTERLVANLKNMDAIRYIISCDSNHYAIYFFVYLFICLFVCLFVLALCQMVTSYLHFGEDMSVGSLKNWRCIVKNIYQ